MTDSRADLRYSNIVASLVLGQSRHHRIDGFLSLATVSDFKARFAGTHHDLQLAKRGALMALKAF
ncbi:hypothetical protein BURK_004437 [Burkholderia sp. SJ98]|nr:hypothetical protein BURK_004437 [Burkholderia sp. SJ98]